MSRSNIQGLRCDLRGGSGGKIDQAQGTGRLFNPNRSRSSIGESRASGTRDNTGIRRRNDGRLGRHRHRSAGSGGFDLGRLGGSTAKRGRPGRFRFGRRFFADDRKRLRHGQGRRPRLVLDRFKTLRHFNLAALHKNFGLWIGHDDSRGLDAHLSRRRGNFDGRSCFYFTRRGWCRRGSGNN